jgi:predicted SPOUT superfamily RNA methylase MTH1
MELFIPSTFGVNERDEKLLVYRIGDLARTIAIFGVDTVTIYRDEDPKADEERNAALLEKYLEYAECPPYLRKALIPHDPDLQYASILPPLQIISHGYSDRFREGVVTETGTPSVVDAGLDDPVEVPTAVEEGSRVTVMHTEDGWELIDPRNIDGFWTFTVENDRRQLGDILADRDRPIIGTAAKGDPFDAFQSAEYSDQTDIGLVFGSAWRGIYDLVERGDCTEDQFDGIYNFVPGQETKTVRTSEALTIVLSVINAL